MMLKFRLLRLRARYPVPKDKRELLPLTELLQKKQKFVWMPNCQSAFENIKSVLVAPNFNAPFKLFVDACDIGVGGVLLQEDLQGIDACVINRKSWTVTSIITLLLIKRLWLCCCPFSFLTFTYVPLLVYTDHNPLVFISKATR